ncbi:MAG: ribonuclease Y [Candidatus Delongbacteria bacterium]|nr:ribonuclease Y [Candidatus Delongbacteria bacterium]MDD4205282.1 ribonuclease Y [Candidatus Delongbacteria bacterium]
MTPYIYLLISLPVGILTGVLFFKWRTESKIGRAKNHAEQIRSEARKEAEVILKDAQANVLKEEIKLKDQLAKEKDKFEEEIRKKENEIHKEQLQLKDKENSIKQQVDEMGKKEKELKSKEQSVEDKKRHLEAKQEEVDLKHKEALEKLQKISGLTKDEVIEELKSQLINDAKNNVAKIVKDIKDQARDTADREAKNIIVNAIQRTAADHSADTTLSVINLPNDDIKGRIIGREGRNIRSFEQATGIEVIVDDTPGAVVLSGFDPYRRAIAKNALERLIQDGRVHPGKIEEIVEKSKKELEKEIKELGENTCMDLAVHNLHPELVKLIGRLNYRTSYGQNVLLHSIECAKLCGLMAAELDYDVKLAVRAGLLHDIGKAIDQYQEGTHVELGIELAKKYKEHKIIINAIAAHHEDAPIMHPIAALVMAADAISSSRPGARRETLGNYLQRLEKLEAVAMGYEGVTKSYAIQAGREIRVLVENEQVDDARADMLAGDIAEQIQNEMKYPGHIKVTVIREYRASSIAK